MSKILEEDIREIAVNLADRVKEFAGKTVLVTGATGLIGSLVVRVLDFMNREEGANVTVIAVVRDLEKARMLLGGGILSSEAIRIYAQKDINSLSVDEDIDYIIHTASPTQSKFFVEKPVETITAIIDGTNQVLTLAKEKKVKKMVFLSSMEMYGVCNDQMVTEGSQGFVSVFEARSSYPMGKRAAETLCFAYNNEYSVPVVVARLAMCFGSGLSLNDNRVHKSFCEAALKGQDIIVKSSGKTVVNFVYSTDAIVAILLLLLDGKPGDAYNIAGDSCSYTIMDMANTIAKMGGVSVKQQIPDEDSGFAPDNTMVLSSEKMRKLGWQPKYDINASLKRLMDYLREDNLAQ